MTEALKGLAIAVTFAGTVIGLIGTVIVGLRFYYLRSSPKTWAWAFFGGPLAWIFGDKDVANYQKFRARMRLFAPMFVSCSILLVILLP